MFGTSTSRTPRRGPRVFSSRLVATIAVVSTIVLSSGPAAYAESVENNVVAGGNDTVAIGASTTVSFQIKPQGNQPCSAADGSPAKLTITPASNSGVTVTPASLTFDRCSTPLTAAFSGTKVGAWDIALSVTDAGGGNYSTASAKFKLNVVAVKDTAGPVLTLPSDITTEAVGTSGAVVSYSATAFDAGDNKSTTVTCSPTSGSTFPIAATTVNCSSSDSQGNSSTGSFKVTVADSTGPLLTLGDTTAEATSSGGAAVAYVATARDAVDGARNVTCVDSTGGVKPSGSAFALGATSLTCSATDTRGNSSTGTLVVVVQDKTAPSLTLPTTTVAEATSAGGALVTYTATAADLVDGAVTPACDRPSGSTFAVGTTTVTCLATDKAGNRGTGTFAVTVGDTTAPTLVLTNETAEATGPDGADVTYDARATDAVDGAVTPQCTPGSGSTFRLGTTYVDCSATDRRSNTAIGRLRVTVQDTTPPTLLLSGITAEATGADGATVRFTPSATDVVSGTVPVVCSAPTGSTFALGVSTVSCSATDGAGNSATGSFSVTVLDRTAPTLALANQEAEATGPLGATVTYSATASDLVDGGVAVTCDRASGSVFPLGSTTVDCTAADRAGNPARDSFTVTVGDSTPPALDAVGRTVEATDPSGATVAYTATAVDLVDGSVPARCSPLSGTTFALGDTTVTCRAEDSRNNFDTKVFTISVVDTTAPEITTTDVTVEATGPSGAAATFAPTATDLVDGTREVACDRESGATFALGRTTVTCTAVDSRRNRASTTFTVEVVDTTAPELALSSQTVEASGPDGARISWRASARDIVDGDLSPTCNQVSGAVYPIGVTTVSCSVEDAAGNEATGAFALTVGDSTAPALTLVNKEAEATKPAGADVRYDARATDVVDGERPITCAPASGSTFPIAVTTVRCAASDTRGNTGEGSLTVTVKDSTPPSLTLTDQLAEATGSDGAAVLYAATAADIVDGGVAVTCRTAAGTPVTSGATFPIGRTTVHCTASDGRGNTGAASFTVTVEDTTGPSLTLTNASAEATGRSGAAVTYLATATDLVDGPLTVICGTDPGTGFTARPSGSTFPIGRTELVCSATDRAGNEAGGSLTVSVTDTTAPVLSLGDVTAEATSAQGARVTYTATAADVVDGTTDVTCGPPSGSLFKLGETSVSCATSDTAGNAVSGSFTVTVKDSTAPILAKPTDIRLTATSAAGATATFAPAATDAVDVSVPAVCNPASGSTFALGVTQVTCQARDKAGNISGSQTFNVTVTVPWSNVASPLNADGSSVYKVGSTIPVKFALSGTAAGIGNLPARVFYAKTGNGLTGSELEAASTSAADAGNLFRYDATAKQYLFNLSTKGFSEGTYQLRVDLGDGVTHTVTITSRK